MPIGGMIRLNRFGHPFTHGETFVRNERTIDLICVCTIQSHMTLLESILKFFESSLITIPAFPVKELSCIIIQGFPDPEFLGFFKVVPHLIDFKNHDLICQCRFLAICSDFLRVNFKGGREAGSSAYRLTVNGWILLQGQTD